MRSATILVLIAIATTANAKPPAPPPAEPAIELRVEGRQLKYTYDLSSLFDKSMWRVLEDNGYSEITVEVRLRDAKEVVRVTQYHTLKIELLSSGKVRLMTTARRGKIYKDRKSALEALSSVRGRPIRAKQFAGEAGHLELTVLVNPVQVFAFPDEPSPLAEQKVVPRTYYDRKMELRSKPVTP